MSYMADLSGVLGAGGPIYAKNSTNIKAGTGLEMNDFLSLMVAQFQNQDIDNTASTSDMMNQMVQMSVVQAITGITTLLNDATTLMYASSLVGKEVTVGQYVNGELTEIRGAVTGTGTLNGQQVIFLGDKSYYLSDVMAIGRLPDLEDITPPTGGEASEGGATA